MPHTAIKPDHRNRAKHLCRTMTRAETLLWRYLKAHRIDGLGFRRQMPLGNLTADFICLSAKLIVELDGETHDFTSRQLADSKRDAFLKSAGFTVLRFPNDDVISNLAGVVEVIRQTASAHRNEPPSLPLPRKGGGNGGADTRELTAEHLRGHQS
jgi:very-short-patch-repair endonuclease